MKTKTPGEDIGRWLKANGWSLGGLTGQDWPALRACAEILCCYSRCDGHVEAAVLSAFRGMALSMLPHNRRFAYHAIAHAMDWGARDTIWARAGLPPFEEHPGYCTEEPARRNLVAQQ